jgi:hypothetical protein
MLAACPRSSYKSTIRSTIETLVYAKLEAEVAYLRPFAPPRPPDGYVIVKEAADIARCSKELIYKRRRLGRLVSTKVRGRIWIDPNTVLVQTD